MLNEILAMSLGQLVLVGLKLSLAFVIVTGMYSMIGFLIFYGVWHMATSDLACTREHGAAQPYMCGVDFVVIHCARSVVRS